MINFPVTVDPFSNAQLLNFIVRLLVACLCGGVIGFERSRRLKDAGIRTHCMLFLCPAYDRFQVRLYRSAQHGF